MFRNGIDRRHFIAFGTAAVAGMAAFPLRGESTSAAPLQLFVGFAPRTGRGRASGRSGAAVFAAASIRRSEPSLLRTGARIGIRKLHRTSAAAPSIRVSMLHRVDDLEEKIPFHAWSYEGEGREASPVSFDVPVDPVAPLEVVVASGGREEILTFTVAPEHGGLALNHGSYILAFAEKEPQWESFTIAGETLELRGQPVPFPYLVLSVSTGLR